MYLHVQNIYAVQEYSKEYILLECTWPEKLRNIETIAQEYQSLTLFHSTHTARSCRMFSLYSLAVASVCWLVCPVLDFFSNLWWFGQHSRTGAVPFLANQTSALKSDPLKLPEFKTKYISCSHFCVSLHVPFISSPWIKSDTGCGKPMSLVSRASPCVIFHGALAWGVYEIPSVLIFCHQSL